MAPTGPGGAPPPSLALLTDFYELTMAAAAWKAGIADQEAAFCITFRQNPFAGGYAVAAGLEPIIEHVAGYRFDDSDLAYLADQRDRRGRALFDPDFLDALRRLEMAIDLDAVPEGTPVFAWEPVLRVKGPIIPCMLLETSLLTLFNFQTLIATKAARVCLAARGDPVVEFGLRRAQGFDGGLSASRAAYLGGCVSTSNVLAGKRFGIPVMGTHAHSWVMLFEDEAESFRAYADAMPGNCVLLVDTYDSVEGVRRAAEVGRRLRERGGELAGVRLDSGDLAQLSKEARRILDEEGLTGTAVVASNELDEWIIESLKEQGARVGVWGVGTRLVTGARDAALGGVYKLTAVRRPGGPWQHRVKLSEHVSKTSVPGLLQVRRFLGAEGYLADCVYDELLGLPSGAVIVDPLDHTNRRELPADAPGHDLLVPIFRAGRLVYQPPPLAAARQRAAAELAKLPAAVKRFVNPTPHPVGLEKALFDLRTRLILDARRLPPGAR